MRNSNFLNIVILIYFLIFSDLKSSLLFNNSYINTKIYSQMDNGKPILKQFGDLKPKDFEDYPIWVLCNIIDYGKEYYDETDEETVRPWLGNIPISPDTALFLIRANFILSDGDSMSGFITPILVTDKNNPDYLGIIQPQLFLKNGTQVSFWRGIFVPVKEEIDTFYKSLDKPPHQIFPIKFKAIEGLSNGITDGIINGFQSYDNNSAIKIMK